MSQTTASDSTYSAKGQRYLEIADELDNLREKLKDVDSIVDEAPVFSTFFHAIRTSKRDGRDGRYVALFDYDDKDNTFTCRSVSFLQNGTHYRDTGCDLKLSYSPYPFLSVDEFAQHMRGNLERQARKIRQNAQNYRQ
jgi:hypothetical protein